MRIALAAVAAYAVLTVMISHAGPLAPAPQVIAEYDRKFIERSGAQTLEELLDTGIIRYFFTGGRDLLVLVNGRPYATTGHNLDSLPLSAVERIEVLRGESLSTLGGHAAVNGAFNIVLRKDLNGFEVRTVTRMPSKDGGDGWQGSLFWGGAVGKGGRMTIGVDILDRQEILGKDREHSRSEWVKGGSFSQARNISVGGNTVYVTQKDDQGEFVGLRSVPLGDCDPSLGYAGPLSNPPGIRTGDEGCGYAYGNIWWDTPSYEQKSAVLNLEYPLGEDAKFHLDANISQGHGAFRYAPSIDVFSFTPNETLLDELKRAAGSDFQLGENDEFSVGHRFIGHGNRDWVTDTEEYDVSASVEGRLAEGLGYDVRVSAYRLDHSVSGDTFVHAGRIREEIESGGYNIANPLDPRNSAAIENSSLQEEKDSSSDYLGARLALEGIGFSIGGRPAAWTAGVELGSVDAHRLLVFRDRDGRTHKVTEVLGSGGTSYAGKRDIAAAFWEMSLPLADNLEIRVGGRGDEYDDIGGLESWRFGAEYRLTGIVTLRGSWSAGDASPSMRHLYSDAAQTHPYVVCDPGSGPPPRTCDSPNYRQVTRETSGNPGLDPSGSEMLSLGAEARKGPFYLVADWYRLTTSDQAGQNSATWAMLNLQECQGGNRNDCIERIGGDITIHHSFANIVDTDISGVNFRYGARTRTAWGVIGMRGFWRRVISSEQQIADEKQRYPLPKDAVRVVVSAGRGNLTAFWSTNYRSEIENQSDEGRFKSWTGHDVTLDWKRPLGWEDVRVTAGVYNVTDSKLSTNTANPSLVDGPTAAGWGRTFFLTLNMRF